MGTFEPPFLNLVVIYVNLRVMSPLFCHHCCVTTSLKGESCFPWDCNPQDGTHCIGCLVQSNAVFGPNIAACNSNLPRISNMYRGDKWREECLTHPSHSVFPLHSPTPFAFHHSHIIPCGENLGILTGENRLREGSAREKWQVEKMLSNLSQLTFPNRFVP